MGGQVKFSPKKRGDTKRFWVVLARDLEVLAMLKGGRKMYPPFKRF